MKKALVFVLVALFALSAFACAQPAPAAPAAEPAVPAAEPAAEPAAVEVDPMAALIEAAKAEGELVVYGSCEEAYLAAACQKFESMYGIKVSYQRLSTGEVATKIAEEAGNPSADVWFGGTTDPYNVSAAEGLLLPYEAMNASHLIDPMFRDKDGNWYGIYKGILGFMVNTEELTRLGLESPKDWDDLLNPEYKGLISYSNPSTAGTGKLIVNTMVQMKGEEAAMEYFKALDPSIIQYTKSGSGPSKMVGPGEIVIGIGFLHDGIKQILDGYDNIALIAPASGTSFEIGATAIFKGCKHENASKLWIEFALSPDCVNIAKDAESYQFLVLDNAEQPKEAAEFGLDNAKLIDYDFESAKENTTRLVEEYFTFVNGDDRFKTE